MDTEQALRPNSGVQATVNANLKQIEHNRFVLYGHV